MSKIITVEQQRLTAEAVKSYVDGLVSELASTTADALEEMDDAKADKSDLYALITVSDDNAGNVTLLVSTLTVTDDDVGNIVLASALSA